MAEAQEGREATPLREYLAIFKLRKWTIVIATILAILAALTLSSRQTPLYRAETRLIVKTTPFSGLVEAENEAEVARSEPVAALVKEDLALEDPVQGILGGVDARTLSPTSEVIIISYVSTDPERARNVANSFAANYFVLKQREINQQTSAQVEAIQKDRAAIQVQIRNITRRLAAARGDGDDARIADLINRRASLAARDGLLQEELNDARSVIEASDPGKILEPASTPAEPFSPNHARSGLLGAFVGILLGAGVAFLQERLDDRFRGRLDVERALEVPVLATVPHFRGGRRAAGSDLPVVTEPKGPASEAYRNLRTGIQFIVTQRDIDSILVTSPSAHEGKTSTTANLGIAMAQTGRRVILISADLRRPQLEKHLGAEGEGGLSSWLLGDVDDLPSLTLEHPAFPNLSLLPAGPIPTNPAELLTSPRLQELLAIYNDIYDLLIFDSPPVLPVADSVILASHVDAALLILDASSTARSAAMHAKEQIERVGGTIIGTVLNAFDPSNTPYYYEPYYYSTYYGRDDEPASNGNEGASSPDVVELRPDNRTR